ncbi:expressed protein [Phakopsora pachyrhizi]|uniref:Expressed protein n=1 Tax=Phakopsora pachyrhizi TaxID=170000 RepID=A0AAV0ARV3_PHAPC|nr:expressed protein [Phakopsora pachyrhizi]
MTLLNDCSQSVGTTTTNIEHQVQTNEQSNQSSTPLSDTNNTDQTVSTSDLQSHQQTVVSTTTNHQIRSNSSSRLKESITELFNRIRGSVNPTHPTNQQKNPEHRGRSKERKVERSVSIGRGGAGNMVTKSSRERSIAADREDNLNYHRRSLNRLSYSNQPRSHGRGGAGNIRSPSRDSKDRDELRRLAEEERRVEVDHADRMKNEPISIGRGGAGNIIHS